MFDDGRMVFECTVPNSPETIFYMQGGGLGVTVKKR